MSKVKSKYVDVYLLPVSKTKLAAYKALARKCSKIFKDHGAIRYREYIGVDLKTMGGPMAFTKVIKLKAGEVLVYSCVEFKNKTARKKWLKGVMQDPRMDCMMDMKPIFDMKRMVVGGFSVIVDT